MQRRNLQSESTEGFQPHVIYRRQRFFNEYLTKPETDIAAFNQDLAEIKGTRETNVRSKKQWRCFVRRCFPLKFKEKENSLGGKFNLLIIYANVTSQETKDKRVIKSILHRIADIIPGGVTINTSGHNLVRPFLKERQSVPFWRYVPCTKDRIDCHNSKCNSYGLQKLPKASLQNRRLFCNQNRIRKADHRNWQERSGKRWSLCRQHLGPVKSGTCAFLSNGAAKTVRSIKQNSVGVQWRCRRRVTTFSFHALHAVRRGNARL